MPLHHRRSIRLRDFDYSQNDGYFVTICTHERRCLLGEVVRGEMRRNGLGWIIQEEWGRTGELRPNVYLDAFEVMPNHVHGILLLLCDDEGAARCAPTPEIPPARRFGGLPAGSLSAVVRAFKAATTRRFRLSSGSEDPLWQQGYYERVIRDERELEKLRDYIIGNPGKWEEDENHPMKFAHPRP